MASFPCRQSNPTTTWGTPVKAVEPVSNPNRTMKRPAGVPTQLNADEARRVRQGARDQISPATVSALGPSATGRLPLKATKWTGNGGATRIDRAEKLAASCFVPCVPVSFPALPCGRRLGFPLCFPARRGLGVAWAGVEDHIPERPGLGPVARFFGQDGEVTQGEVAIDALIDATKLVADNQLYRRTGRGHHPGTYAIIDPQAGAVKARR